MSLQFLCRHGREHVVDTRPAPDRVHRASLERIVDYELPAASENRLRAIATMPDHFASQHGWRSSWHYHECELQLAIILKGSLEVSYQPDRASRASAGDILFIPGRALHDVGAPSADYQVAEVTFPGSFSTIESSAPPMGAPTAARILTPQEACLKEVRGVLAHSLYPLAEPYYQRLSLWRVVHGGDGVLDEAWQSHDEACRITYVLRGCRELEVAAGERQRLEALDIVVIPRGTRSRDRDISSDYDAVDIVLLDS